MSDNEESKEGVDEGMDIADVHLALAAQVGNAPVLSMNGTADGSMELRPAIELAIDRYHQALDSFRFADTRPGAPECAFTGIYYRGGQDFLRSLEQDQHVELEGRTIRANGNSANHARIFNLAVHSRPNLHWELTKTSHEEYPARLVFCDSEFRIDFCFHDVE